MPATPLTGSKGGANAGIRVVCRVRPRNSKEMQSESCVKAEGESIEIVGEEHHTFTFDAVFGPEGTQRQLYDAVAAPILEDVMCGFNGTIFAYGQTSSGKTHTMQGPDLFDTEQQGLIPRALTNLFQFVEAAPEDIDFMVKLSLVEIYMERVCDLFEPSKGDLRIREDKQRGVWLEGVTEHYVASPIEALQWMKHGEANRSVAATQMNSQSSRSHLIFIVTLIQQHTRDGGTKTSRLYLVDLAGSEKISRTGAAGQTLEEAKMINKSLSALGNVINALTDGKSSHIPYRDSKLTRILSESLGGNSRTALVINMSPSELNEMESVSTARFGSRAKKITNKARVNVERSPAEMKAALSAATKEIEVLKAKLADLEGNPVTPRADEELTDSPGRSATVISAERVTAMEEEIVELQREKDVLADEVMTLREEVDDRDRMITQLRQEADKLGQFEDVIADRERLQEAVDELSTKMRRIESHKDEETQAKARLANELVQLRKAYQAAVDEASNAKEAASILQRQLDQAKADAAASHIKDVDSDSAEPGADIPSATPSQEVENEVSNVSGDEDRSIDGAIQAVETGEIADSNDNEVKSNDCAEPGAENQDTGAAGVVDTGDGKVEEVQQVVGGRRISVSEEDLQYSIEQNIQLKIQLDDERERHKRLVNDMVPSDKRTIAVLEDQVRQLTATAKAATVEMEQLRDDLTLLQRRLSTKNERINSLELLLRNIRQHNQELQRGMAASQSARSEEEYEKVDASPLPPGLPNAGGRSRVAKIIRGGARSRSGSISISSLGNGEEDRGFSFNSQSSPMQYFSKWWSKIKK